MKVWIDEDEDADDMKLYAMSEDQILALWKVAEGHAIRFARLIESFHGCGVILKDDNAG